MANTITGHHPVVNITVNDADWTGEHRAIHSIQFLAGAANDVLVIKHGDANGPVIFQSEAAAATDEIIKYFHGKELQPFIDVSACTVGSTFLVIVIYG